MPVSGEFTWEETDGHIKVAIPLKGVSPKKVDVFTASSILKVSYAPFLLDLNLYGEIDEESSRAVLKNGTLKICLVKKINKPWGQLCFEGTKNEIMQRRRKALKDRDEKVHSHMERVASKKVEEERMVFQQHMALEEKERHRLDHIKAREKKNAEDAMYTTFSRLQNEKSPENLPTKGIHFKPEKDGAPHEELAETMDAKQQPQDDKGEESEATMPPPRKVTHSTFRHTPRLFKTPSRESTIKQEQEFIIKNRSNLKKNVLLNDVDIGDVDPVWLNSKGDECYGKGDFCSAINAYTEALEADETMVHALGNRAASYLHLREGTCCIKDCLVALKMSDASESQFDTLLETIQFRKKIHTHLALAYCLNEEYAKAIEAFQQLDENDESAIECIRHLEVLMEATQLKAKADSSFAEGDLINANEFYTQALSVDPTLVTALMNRAACHLAMENATDCIDDCTLALKLVSGGSKPKHEDSPCLITAFISPKPSVQRKWSATLLCRRAAAKRMSGDCQGASIDSEELAKLETKLLQHV
ncbi:hypothetical protein ACHAXR_013000 [Thalassiosira sp. AJA248-18]